MLGRAIACDSIAERPRRICAQDHIQVRNTMTALSMGWLRKACAEKRLLTDPRTKCCVSQPSHKLEEVRKREAFREPTTGLICTPVST